LYYNRIKAKELVRVQIAKIWAFLLSVKLLRFTAEVLNILWPAYLQKPDKKENVKNPFFIRNFFIKIKKLL